MSARYLYLFIFLIISRFVYSQTGNIKGRIYNSINNESVPFANVIIEGTTQGVTSDIDGNYVIKDLKPGIYNLVCSFVGFKKAYISEITVTPVRPAIVDIPLVENAVTLSEITIESSPFRKTEESPLSVKSISATEIYRNPGGNRDISKVIQALPGVASSTSFRNDIIIRGGAPNENRFYLDGIEVPNINHFATQGSSGGPVGMINVNFIENVDFYTGAFPVNRGNALSSVMELKQIEGNNEKLTGTVLVGSSDIGLTLNGPMGEKSSFILSARRSYLQFLFKALKLPFLPTYNDFQYKQSVKINEKNKVTIIGLGAIDDFALNQDANDGVTDIETIERNNYILGNIPVNSQWNYAIGANWTHYGEKNFQTFVISRNHLNNESLKYQNNIETAENLLLDYNSQEIENKIRIENTFRDKGWKVNVGIGFEDVRYTNSTFNKIERNGGISTVDFSSELKMNKYAVFGSVSKDFFNSKLILSFGLRTDFSDYSSDMSNPLEQLSPRLSASYSLTDKTNINFNVARYYQLPAYTVLGYRNAANELVNKNNGLTYISADHLVGGVEFNPTKYAQITVEGFYKKYNNYPFLLDDSISLANLGGDFGIIGNEAANSSSEGRSYGIEISAQQKLSATVYGIFSYTFVRSEFLDKDGNYIPTAWDNRHLISFTAGKKLSKNWEVGFRFRLLGGAPYTPYDVALSTTKQIWDITNEGILDWSRLNEERNDVFHNLDIRIDKKWYFKKWSLNAYLDIQNFYNFESEEQPFLNVATDVSGNPITDPNNSNRYQVDYIENTSGSVLPSIGLMVEF